MRTIAIVQIAVLLLLGLAALAPGTFFAMLLLGGAAAGALRYWGWDWTVALQMGLAGALCLPALRIFAAGRLLAAGVVIIAVPALLISRLGLGATWTHSALYAVVLLLLLPTGVLRSLLRLGVIKPPSVPTVRERNFSEFNSSDFSHFKSSAPSYPSRSEVRTPR